MSFVGLFVAILSCDENTDLLQSLELEQSKYEVSARQQTLDVKLFTNADFDVVSNVDWISGSKVTVNDSSYVRLEIAGYDDLERDRVGTVDVKLSNTDIVRTIIITQKYRLVAQSDRKWYDFYPEEQTFEITVKSNSDDYDVTISAQGKDWLTQVLTPGTKAMTEKTLTFHINENESSQSRYAEIYISLRESNDTDTIHITQNGLNNMFLPYLLSKDSKCQIFYRALQETRLRDTLEQYLDHTYPYITYDSTDLCYFEGNTQNLYSMGTAYEKYYIVWPEKRVFKYTLFVVPDSILRQYGINNLEELRLYAQSVYPDGAGLPEEDRNNSLNKLISYHILPCALTYDQLNTSSPDIVNHYKKWDEQDIEDFYETLLPHSIMRISTPKGAGDNPLGVYINRKGTFKNGPVYRGTRIATTAEYENDNQALNGVYHYVDGLLLYDDATKYGALRTRIRVLTGTLSPDFINSGAHGRIYKNDGRNHLVYNFKQGYCRNFYYDESVTRLNICDRYKYAPLGENSFIRGVDVAFKLPPVAYSATYEIRLLFSRLPLYTGEPGKQLTQFSLFESDSPNPSGDYKTWNWTACGDAVDLRQTPEQWISDNDPIYDGLTEEQRMEAILANDKILRESGYMKGMDIYHTGDTRYTLRDEKTFLRRIVTNSYMDSNKDYYLRLELIESDGDFDFFIPCIELVPKDIYAGLEPEDWH